MRGQVRSQMTSLPVGIVKPGTVVEAVRASIHRPVIDDAPIVRVLAAYGRRQTGRARNFTLGWRNAIVAVPTDLGTVVVKRYGDRWTSSTILHEHGILDELGTRRFPAVRLLHTEHDNASVVEDEGSTYAVFGFVAGRSYSGRWVMPRSRGPLFRHFGSTLVELHATLSAYTPPGSHHLGYAAADGPGPRGLLWHLDALDRLKEPPDRELESGALEDWVWLEQRRESIAERLVRLDGALSELGLTVTVIHGDFGPHNAIIDPEGHTVIHDFELARVDWALIDLISGLSRWRPASAAAFLAGYRDAVGPRGKEELARLDQVWRHYRLCGAIQSWHTFVNAGDPRRLATARMRVVEAARIQELGLPEWLR